MPQTLSKSSRPPTSSEQALVGDVRAGDDRAFEELYARYRERIFSFILSRVHDHGRAEDIAQDVFMSALRRLRGSDQAIAFKPWIYEIAKNACIDEFRRGTRNREVPLEADGEFVVDRHKSALAAVPTPAAAVESKQRLDDLRGAFGGLSTTHHQLLVMREFEGLSYDEIGERLDMTRQMVESSLFRARRKLSGEYQELASGQRCEQTHTAIESGRLRAVGSLGLRDRRRFGRHLSHCQPCRYAALMAGVDEALLKPRSIAAKIAGLLPFPLWRLPWHSRGAKAASAGGSHHVAGGGSAGLASSAGSAITFGQAAATVAVVIAGAGGGLAVHGLTSGGHGDHLTNAAQRSAHQASSTSHGSAASSSAAAAKAAHGRASLTTGTSAFSVTGSQATSSRPGTTRRRQRGSAPGAPGSGTSGGSSGTARQPGTAGSLPSASRAATKVVNGVTGGVKKAVNGVTNTLNGVAGVAGGVGKTVSTATNGAVNPSQTLSTVTKVVGSAGNGVASTGSKVVNGATGAVTGGVPKVASGLTGGSSSTSTGSAPPPASSSGSSTASGSNPLAPVTSGASSTVTGVTQPHKSAAGGLVGGK